MSPTNAQSPRKTRAPEPYWFIIAALLLAGIGLYAYHLATGRTPSRVALHVGFLNFDIFWYGILIVGGIALGAYVTSRLAYRRAVWAFHQAVPAQVRILPISELELPEEIEMRLAKRKIDNLGPLLFEAGLGPERLALNKEGVGLVAEALASHDRVEQAWLESPAWRRWNPEHVWAGIAWALVLGVIGARIYHILTPSPSMAAVGINSPLDYLRNPLQMINVRSGGLGIYGGLIGGALGLWIYTRRQRIPFLVWTDLAVVGLALGQAIGRWGNFLNQELYGRPTDLPWAVFIDPIHRLSGYESFETFHPAFLYASIMSLLAFLLLYWLARDHWQALFLGDLTALYLILQAVSRMLLEFVRLDSRTVVLGGVDLGVPVATAVSLAIALPMAGLLASRHLLRRGQAKSE